MGISHVFFIVIVTCDTHIVMLVVVDYAHNQSGLFRGFQIPDQLESESATRARCT